MKYQMTHCGCLGFFAGVCVFLFSMGVPDVSAAPALIDGRVVEWPDSIDGPGGDPMGTDLGNFGHQSDIGLMAIAGSREVDVVGGTNASNSGNGLAKGNAYRVDTSVTLLMAEFYLNFSNSQTLQFYVYESPVEFGTYTQIFTVSETVAGTGEGWYSSGPIGIELVSGMYYVMAVSWSGSCQYYYNTGDSQPTSFGAEVYGYATGTHPLPASFDTSSNDQAIYFQRLTTSTGGVTPTPEPTDTPSPSATPTDEPCIHDGDVNLDGELSAGDAQMAFLITLGSYSPTWEQECASDCNGDDEVTAGDAQLIFMAVLGSGNCEDGIR